MGDFSSDDRASDLFGSTETDIETDGTSQCDLGIDFSVADNNQQD